ncbi:MAG: hypothetical protein IJ134_03555 [Bacilli bacterium]|nr:hypothetical protein [Bacilli bacterium]
MVINVDNIGTIDIKCLPIIGIGNEARCYKYKNIVLKIYHNRKDLNKEQICFLSQFNTKNIIMPKDLIYDRQNKLIGYTKNFVEERKNVRKINNINLISELKNIRNEVDLLSSNNILLADCGNLDNILYDGHIRFIDSGYYTIEKNDTYLRNIQMINLVIYYLLFDTFFYDDGDLKEVIEKLDIKLNFFKKLKIKKIISQLVNYNYKLNTYKYIDYLIDELENCKSINEYRINLFNDALVNIPENDFLKKEIKKLKIK